MVSQILADGRRSARTGLRAPGATARKGSGSASREPSPPATTVASSTARPRRLPEPTRQCGSPASTPAAAASICSAARPSCAARPSEPSATSAWAVSGGRRGGPGPMSAPSTAISSGGCVLSERPPGESACVMSRADEGLTGRVAVVVGAGGGLGRDLACALAERGMRLVLAGRTRRSLDETGRVLRSAAGYRCVGGSNGCERAWRGRSSSGDDRTTFR